MREVSSVASGGRFEAPSNSMIQAGRRCVVGLGECGLVLLGEGVSSRAWDAGNGTVKEGVLGEVSN